MQMCLERASAEESSEECYDKLNFMQFLCSNVEWLQSWAEVRCIIKDVAPALASALRMRMNANKEEEKNPNNREKCCKSIFHFPR